MSTHNIHLKYRTLKRYPTIISIVPPSVALIVTFRGLNYHCLEQIFIVPNSTICGEIRKISILFGCKKCLIWSYI